MPVPPELYPRDYYLSDRCEGYEHYSAGTLSFVKQYELDALGVRPGMRVLDAGCGRGEVLRACADAGAMVAGVDYSPDAVELSRAVLSDVDGADVRQASVTDLPWRDEAFDRVLMGDVIEHLDPDEAQRGMREIYRVLRPDGMALVHTAPNRLFRRWVWPLARPVLNAAGHREAVDNLDWYLADVLTWHVNEQSLPSLRRAVRKAGFVNVHAWVDRDVIRGGAHRLTTGLDSSPLVSTVARLAGGWPQRILLGNDLYARGWKPAEQRLRYSS